MKNPGCEGNNNSRSDFTYNYFHTWQGRIFNTVIKSGMRDILKRLEQMILIYDKDAFKFDDPRLKRISELSEFNFNRKDDDEPMRQAVRIALFIMKEDIYYRSRFLAMLSESKDISLTDNERKNLGKW